MLECARESVMDEKRRRRLRRKFGIRAKRRRAEVERYRRWCRCEWCRSMDQHGHTRKERLSDLDLEDYLKGR